ncbi:MAG: VanZ family protein [Bacteroidales bacterium]|nr:VanZ family protein [Bacteroidales bacterium]MCF8458980.1 VanZ family protein [Bacteroidales bacterium]
MLIKRHWKSILFYLFLLVLSLLPASDNEEPTRKFFDIGLDKFKHVAAFALLGFLLIYEISRKPLSTKQKLTPFLFSLLLASLGGILIEVLQASFPSLGRTFNPVDIFANTIGCSISLLVVLWIYLKRKP